MHKILVVEDDTTINQVICEFLKENHYEVTPVFDGAEALREFEEKSFDLIILDVMLPSMSGLDVLKEIRKTSQVPVMMLTALDDEYTQLVSFNHLISDYVTKPFDPDELLARIKVILKRYSINSSNIITIKDVVFDGDKYEIRYKDQKIHLPLKQFELAFELAKNPNQIFTREQLIEKIWGMDYDGFDRTVDVHIKRVRENLGHLPGFKVVTVRGLGYKIEVEE